jgi:hypothetical protein
MLDKSFHWDLQTGSMYLAQVIDIVCCYPPQLEGGEFPRRDFAEAPEESTSIAPTTSHASTKRKNVVENDRVEDSEDFDDHDFSSYEDDDLAIPAKPLASRPPPRSGKKVLPNFSIDASTELEYSLCVSDAPNFFAYFRSSMMKFLGVLTTGIATIFSIMTPPLSRLLSQRRRTLRTQNRRNTRGRRMSRRRTRPKGILSLFLLPVDLPSLVAI